MQSTEASEEVSEPFKEPASKAGRALPIHFRGDQGLNGQRRIGAKINCYLRSANAVTIPCPAISPVSLNVTSEILAICFRDGVVTARLAFSYDFEP